MVSLKGGHSEYWKNRSFRLSVIEGGTLLFLSLIANHFASLYADMRASNYVTDLLLDNLPVLDVDGILVYGALAFVAFVACCLATDPKKTPFVLKSTGLFYLIRSVFIMLTHLGPMPVETPIEVNNFLATMISGNDFFFSGHTGLPFLAALLFWERKLVRNVSLFVSVLFGACVILGHLHYSIDVFAAFFISYGIFHISIKAFPKSYRLSNE